MSFCATHGAYSTTNDVCPQCGSHARLVFAPYLPPTVPADRRIKERRGPWRDIYGGKRKGERRKPTTR